MVFYLLNALSLKKKYLLSIFLYQNLECLVYSYITDFYVTLYSYINESYFESFELILCIFQLKLNAPIHPVHKTVVSDQMEVNTVSATLDMF